MIKLCLAISLFGCVRLLGYFTDPRLNDSQIHQIAGEPSRVAAPVPPAASLKIVSWNIERGQAYEAVLTALRALDADVLLLQEVDRGCRRTNYRDVARALAHALDLNWTSAGEFQEIGEARDGMAALTGQAILSRFPIEDPQLLLFRSQDRLRWSMNPVQPRRGGRIALQARTAGVVVYNTHIESGGDDALGRRQIVEILEDHERRHSPEQPVVIGGDFNNGPIRRAPMFGNLSAAQFTDALGPDGDRGATSFGQTHPIDWIFVKNATAIFGRVVHTVNASDHFPIVAALENSPPFALR
jgi:endonuclease/exonuclease/phosphatase family metal-dependent hydrolase